MAKTTRLKAINSLGFKDWKDITTHIDTTWKETFQYTELWFFQVETTPSMFRFKIVNMNPSPTKYGGIEVLGWGDKSTKTLYFGEDFGEMGMLSPRGFIKLFGKVEWRTFLNDQGLVARKSRREPVKKLKVVM